MDKVCKGVNVNMVLEIIKTALFINLFLWIHRTYLINCALKYDTTDDDIKTLKEVLHRPRNVPINSGIIGRYEKYHAMGLFDKQKVGCFLMYSVNKYHTLTLRRRLKRLVDDHH